MAGLYIHIPFCAQKCIYCDFYSIVSSKYLEEYLNCVVKELELRQNELRNEQIETIYIGGGTPSLISGDLLIEFVNSIKNRLGNINQLAEFTIEVNPDDITAEYVASIKQCGINRVSMGVQSFIDSELQTIKRRHNAAQAINAFNVLRSNGINNISIDLIYGLPGQNLDSWEYNLKVAMDLAPNHISVYSLMYEEGTLLYRMRKEGKIKECSDELYVAMDNELQNVLSKNGYIRYEISNYSLEGYESIHNSNYWNSTPYLGIGAGAHSFDGNVRRYNPNDVRGYINSISKGSCFYIEEKETPNEIYNDYVMTHLRTLKGIRLEEFRSKFHERFIQHFNRISTKYIKLGEMTEENGYIHINNKCFMISDSIISDLLYD